MLKIIKYSTPTRLEAERIRKLVFLVCKLDGDPMLFTGTFDNPTPVIRVGLYGNPDVEVHFCIGTYNRALLDDDSGWSTAVPLYFKTPWPVSLWIAWMIFAWNCITGKRKVDRYVLQRYSKEYQRTDK